MRAARACGLRPQGARSRRCTSGRCSAPAPPSTHLPKGIDWFDGDVDAAFAAAKAADKPLFLYWGAEWCPPCSQIKATIFNQREFQERSRLFVPVYLDGDTPSAQKHGENFAVNGYPTMILFRSDGKEITRLPGGVDVTRYATILDVALADARPVDRAARGCSARAMSCRTTTGACWPIIPGSPTTGTRCRRAERIATFRQLSARCPVELEADCTRLFFEYLYSAAAVAGRRRRAVLGPRARRSTREAAGAAWQALGGAGQRAESAYGATDAIGLLSDQGSPERGELTAAWTKALDMLGQLVKPVRRFRRPNAST